jgi:hypothetical protein
VIATIEQSDIGVQMRRATFLLNQFLIDHKEAQDKGMEFHYAWLLILIELVAWKEPKETQFVGAMRKPCLAT